MKRAIYPALLVALVLVVPALSQSEGEDLAKRVSVLEEKVAEQEGQITELSKHVEAVKKEAARLAKSLGKAEKDGFTYPAPNTAAKEELLKGLQRFAKVASGAKIKDER